MNLDPLFSASIAIQIHFFTVVPAFLLGTVQMVLPKGTRLHRTNGYAYMTLMMITATAAAFIPSYSTGFDWLFDGHFGIIHLFVVLTYVTVPLALWNARKGNIRAHRGAMTGLYIGAILVAGTLAFLPGRIMHEIVFG